jgi:hypothetical protein
LLASLYALRVVRVHVGIWREMVNISLTPKRGGPAEPPPGRHIRCGLHDTIVAPPPQVQFQPSR